MSAIITPPRLGIARRLLGAIQAAYIRALIRSAAIDEALAEQQVRMAPQMLALAKGRIAELRIHLLDAELGMLRRWIV